ncbi:MAG: hypothetical protein RLO81_16730 [Fulvivirga sp.]|uniref:hypothetical protein n=1 Tax=Fulvivirga sp. TaxID=1931237 RepID=UPI0032EABEB1
MTRFLATLTHFGVRSDTTDFEMLRIRLINIFALLAGGLTLVFGTLNVTLGIYTQGILIYSGLFILTVPTLNLNNRFKTYAAK